MGFFDQLGKKASDTMQSAKDKTSKLSTEIKLKSQLSEKKDKIANLYSEIGKEVYDNSIKGINDITESLNEKIQEITKLIDEQKEINNEILKVKGIKICASCGGQIPAGSEFCPKCGNKVAQVVEKAPETATQAEVVEEPKSEE